MFNYNISQLENGITVITENVPHVKSFSLGFWITAGSRDETDAINGISHFIEHMVFKGTSKRTARKISDEIESVGGYINAYTSKELTCFYVRGLGKYAEKSFEVISDMLQNSLFKDNEIKKEANVILEELKDVEDTPEDFIFDKFEEFIYEGNSLKYPILGNENSIFTFNNEILSAYSKIRYNTNNLLIVAAGAVEHSKITEYANKYLSTLHVGQKCKRSPLNLTKHKNVYLNKEIAQIYLLMGKTTVGYTSEERIKLNILSNLLGETSSSRLFQRLREKNGISYQINSYLNSFSDISTIGVFLSTNEKNIEKAYGLITEEFKKLREKPVSKNELNRVKEYLKGSYWMGLESMSNRASRMAHSYINFGRIKNADETIMSIDNVTIEDIQELATRELDEHKMLKIIAGKKNMLAKIDVENNFEEIQI